MSVSGPELGAIEEHVERAVPFEACGVVLMARDGRRRLLPCTNVHSDPRHAFLVSDHDRLAIQTWMLQGFMVRVVYHSHVDTPALLSSVDRRAACDPLTGAPWMRDVTYLILGVLRGKVAELRAYVWDDRARDFRDATILDHVLARR